MAWRLHDLLTRDHERLDARLAASVRDDGSIDQESYGEFRQGLLWHIGVEEKILFPEVRKRSGENEIVRQLHREHAALAALLMPPPTVKEIETISAILEEHNPLEEDEGGLYEQVETLMGDELEPLLERIRSTPPARLAPHADTEVTRWSIEQLLLAVEEGRQQLRR